MARKLEVIITGDAKGLSRAYGQATGQTKKFGGSLLGLSKGTTAAGAGIAGLAIIAKTGFAEFSEGQKVAAQTEAVLKSTGGVANVTAKDVTSLASAISAKTGIDDEAIHASQNLLLTFKNVRNEVGQGNAVFDRATQAATDLSVAGFGSLSTTSKQLGKALQDPVRGMLALSRAGVTFSAEQKKTIKALVESGHALEAQKLILKEVESQVGGSAEAFGKTLPGQIQRSKIAFEELSGTIVGKVAPALSSALEPALAALPTVISTAGAAIGGAMNILVSSITLPFKTVAALIQGDWAKAWDALKAPAEAALNALAPLWDGPITDAGKKATELGGKAISGVVSGLTGIVGKVGDFVGAIPPKIASYFTAALGRATELGGKIKSGAVAGVTGIAASVWDVVSVIGTRIASFFGSILNWGTGIGSRIKSAAVTGVTGIAGAVWGVVGQIGDRIAAFFGTILGWGEKVGSRIKTGAVSGVTGIAGAVWTSLEAIGTRIEALAGVIKGWGRKVGSAIKTGVVGVADTIAAAVGTALGGILGIVEGIVSAINGITSAANAAISAVNSIPRPFSGKNTSGTPIPKALGGPVGKGRPYLVGERGPEVFVPDAKGKIVPRIAELGAAVRGKAPAKAEPVFDSSKVTLAFTDLLGSLSPARAPALAGAGGGTARMAGGGMAMAGGGVTYNVDVHVAGSVISERDLALKVRDALVRGGIRNGGGMLANQA